MSDAAVGMRDELRHVLATSSMSTARSDAGTLTRHPSVESTRVSATASSWVTAKSDPLERTNGRGNLVDEWRMGNEEHDRCCSQLVVSEENLGRSVWNIVIAVLLAYVATIFLYRLCFVEFHMPEPLGENDVGWRVFDEVVNSFFWLDLLVNFFFSYRDKLGNEVDSLRLTARHYISGFFILDFLACSPDWVIRLLVEHTVMPYVGGDDALVTNHTNRAVRVMRLQRASRLTRLVRLARLAKLVGFKSSGPLWRWFQALRGVRVINFVVGLLWTVHLLACGWYLCASLSEDHNETWLARRAVDTAGEIRLLDRGPMEHWFHSMYFVLTVFTTVGFGDMSAVTTGEIIYVCFTMLVGAVVHGIIISEVINIVMSVDQTSAFVTKQHELVRAFAEHTELDTESTQVLGDWISFSAKTWMSSRYDRDEMQQMITGKYMPRWLLGQLPRSLFGGVLLKSRFLAACEGLNQVLQVKVPPRLALLLALAVTKRRFEAGELVYQMCDFPFNVFLVLEGTFAHIARPTPKGGVDEMCDGDHKMELDWNYAVINPDMIQKKGSQSSLEGPARTPSDNAGEQQPPLIQLYPYQLFSCNSYFGDVELFQGRPRRATVRCESAGGTALVLAKHEFWRLAEEFPHFGAGWRRAAHRRAAHRERLLRQLTHGLTHRHLAALRIQRYFRKSRRAARRRRRRNALGYENSNSNNPGTGDDLIATNEAPLEPKADGDEFSGMGGGSSKKVCETQVHELQVGMHSLRADVRALRREVRAGLVGIQQELLHGAASRRHGPSGPELEMHAPLAEDPPIHELSI